MTYVSPDYRQHILDKIKIGAHYSLSHQLLADARVDVIDDILTDALLVRLSTFVLADKLVADHQTVTLDVPASWWQHFKRDCLGWIPRYLPLWLVKRLPRKAERWYLRHRPVRMITVVKDIDFTRMHVYPSFPYTLPPETYGRAVIVEEANFGPWRWPE